MLAMRARIPTIASGGGALLLPPLPVRAFGARSLRMRQCAPPLLWNIIPIARPPKMATRVDNMP